MAKILLGGKSGKDIMFVGNPKFIPARVMRVVRSYFGQWNVLRDITKYPALLEDLGDVGAQRFFADTDWDQLQEFYKQSLARFELVFKGKVDADGAVSFAIGCPHGAPARPIEAILHEYCADGVLRDNFDLWRVDKLVRRAKARLRYTGGFTAALKVFGQCAVSFEESLSFFRQIQAYHAHKFLLPQLDAILAPCMDSLHVLHNPLALNDLAEQLRAAGADVRVHESCQPVVEHYAELRAATAATESAVTELLTETLYPFQREGVAYLVTNKRALLADDMGLGKTIQAIAAAVYLKEAQGLKRALVICPASLKYQWQSEIHRFTAERCAVIGGEKAERETIYSAASGGGLLGTREQPFFYVVNYELVHRDIEQLKALGAELLIIDEAQRVKNFRTKTAQAVFELPAAMAFVLTGTPLENQLMELYTIMRFIEPRALGKNPITFRERYVVQDRFGGVMGYRHVEEVSRKIAAVTLRRTKEQTLEDLPPLIEVPRWLDLSPTQRTIYQELQGQAREMLGEEVWSSVQSTNALTLLQRLRETCDTAELIDPALRESQKIEELLPLLEDEVRSLGRQALVFTQWTRMGEILVRELGQAQLRAAFLHGGVPAKQRQELVRRFQAGEDRILISTDAGGVGLNLQAASLVVNFDLPFNPAKIDQRVARAHRLGQTGTVIVVNLLSRATVEEKMMRILAEKKELFNDVFGDISDPAAAADRAQQMSIRDLLRELV